MRSSIFAIIGAIGILWIGLPKAQAQDRAWSPTRYTARSSYRPIASTEPQTSAVSLGAPKRVIRRQSKSVSASTNVASWSNPRGRRRGWSQPRIVPDELNRSIPNTAIVSNRPRRPIYRGQAPDAVPPPGGVTDVPPPPPPPPPSVDPLFGAEPFNNGMIGEDAIGANNGFGNKLRGFFLDSENPNRRPFQSEPFFEQFVSPISSPFLSEDPRSLTEVRPLFIYQNIPDDNPRFQGGNVLFFGLQARVALTERFSFVLNKLGGVSLNPDNELGGFDGSSFAEIWLGPKFTIIRNDKTNTLLATGVTFQIPAGSSSVAQDTGDLSIAPYLSFGQSFCVWGSDLNFINTTGYSFAVGGERAEYFYSNFHVDYNWFRRIYATLELNWLHYTKNGTRNAQDFEGGSLINFGANDIEGNDLLTLAPGVRYKFSECVQMGAAVEFPLVGRKDLNNFSFTLDFIWRY